MRVSKLSCSFIVQLLLPFILAFFNLASPKPLLLENPFLNNQTVKQQSHDRIFLPQSDVVEPDKRIIHESDAVSSDEIDELLDSRVAHNRTARNTHGCVAKSVREFDHCRNRYVTKVQCSSMHPACNHVIDKYKTPKCVTVLRSSRKCPSLPIDCQCAAL